MSDILPISSTGSTIVTSSVKEGVHYDAGVALQEPAADQVEISATAQMLSRLDDASEIRTEKVAAIREAILNGTYETDNKIDYSINRLLEVVVLDV